MIQAQIVGDHERAHPEVVLERGEQGQDLAAHRGVQRRHGFVGDEHLRSCVPNAMSVLEITLRSKCPDLGTTTHKVACQRLCKHHSIRFRAGLRAASAHCRPASAHCRPGLRPATGCPAGDRGASGRRPDAPAGDRTPLPPAPDSPVGDQAAPPGDRAPGRRPERLDCRVRRPVRPPVSPVRCGVRSDPRSRPCAASAGWRRR
jgi:hypothetical protein